MLDTLMRRTDPDSYIQITIGEHVTKLRVVRGAPCYTFENARGKRVWGDQVEKLLKTPGMELVVHDGEHKTGPCGFSFRGFITPGRFV